MKKNRAIAHHYDYEVEEYDGFLDPPKYRIISKLTGNNYLRYTLDEHVTKDAYVEDVYIDTILDTKGFYESDHHIIILNGDDKTYWADTDAE